MTETEIKENDIPTSLEDKESITTEPRLTKNSFVISLATLLSGGFEADHRLLFLSHNDKLN